MKPHLSSSVLALCLTFGAAACFSGCATTDSSSSGRSASTPAAGGGKPSSYRATDGRTILIGKSGDSDGGLSFREPHMEKCWIAGDFDFKGYDTLYIAPVMSTAKPHEDEIPIQEIAKRNLLAELSRAIAAKGIFGSVVTSESDIKPGQKTLKLANTIIDYSKGGGAARYFVGLYGGGQPVLRVQGVMLDGDKTVFSYTIRRSGTSAGSRMGGAAMRDEDIQLEDIQSMVLDLTDFIAAISGKYPPN